MPQMPVPQCSTKFLSLPAQGESGILFAVCGGKWSEGLDYRGEMLAGAMVVGLPLAPFTRVRRMVIEYFRRRYGEEGEFICYTLPAINKRSRRSDGSCARPRTGEYWCSGRRGSSKKGYGRRFLPGSRTRWWNVIMQSSGSW